MKRPGRLVRATISCFLFGAVGLLAQQTDDRVGSVGPAASVDNQTAGQQTERNPTPPEEQGIQANRSLPPLSGAKSLTLGSEDSTDSYLLPGIQSGALVDANSNLGPQSKLVSAGLLGGSLTLQRVQMHSLFYLDYAGDAYVASRGFSAKAGASNGSFDRVGIFEQVSSRRWKAFIDDDAFYLPVSLVGFQGFAGVEGPGAGPQGLGQLGLGGGQLSSPTGLSPTLIPSQSILTGPGRRLSNIAAAELQFQVGPRSVLTSTISYGTLDFLDPGFVNSNYVEILSGYNHSLTTRDSLAISYVHVLFQFHTANNRDVLDRGVQLSYGRQLSRRLLLQVSAAPVVVQTATPGAAPTSTWFLSTYDTLKFDSPKAKIALSFLRHTTAGSGVLVGAETNRTELTVGRALGRKAHVDLHFSEAFNKALTPASPTSQPLQYQLWGAGTTLYREFGERWGLFLAYDVQRQDSNAPTCSAANCVAVAHRQLASLGFTWHGPAIRVH